MFCNILRSKHLSRRLRPWLFFYALLWFLFFQYYMYIFCLAIEIINCLRVKNWNQMALCASSLPSTVPINANSSILSQKNYLLFRKCQRQISNLPFILISQVELDCWAGYLPSLCPMCHQILSKCWDSKWVQKPSLIQEFNIFVFHN